MSLEAEFQKHAPFLRALARRLSSDAFAADDLVQETYAAAVVAKPDPQKGMLPWLSTVLRNRAARRVRTEVRRTQREQLAVATEVTDDAEGDASSVASRLELGRRLLEHVDALGGDYRDVVFLRYYDDLTPKQIAERLRQPVATVKTRLARALQRLRDRLDADSEGGRQHWLPGMCALGGLDPASGASVALPAMRRAFSLRLLLAAAVALASLGVWLASRGWSEPQAPEVHPVAAQGGGDATVQSPVSMRQAVTAPAEATVWRGTVEDAGIDAPEGSGLPAAGVAVTCELRLPTPPGADARFAEQRELAVVTDARGRFSFEVEHGASVLSVKAEASSAHRRASWFAHSEPHDPDQQLVLRRYPHGLLVGYALEPSGEPVPGARVWLGYREGEQERRIETTADDRGRFVFDKVPNGSWLRGSRQGFVQVGASHLHQVHRPTGGFRTARVVLSRAATLTVEIVDTQGQPLRGLPGVAVMLDMREQALLAAMECSGYRDRAKAPEGTAVLAVPSGLELALFVGHTTYARQRGGRLVPETDADPASKPILLASGEQRTLRVALATDVVLRGKVVDLDGAPIAADVTVMRLANGRYSSMRLHEVEAEGGFEHRFALSDDTSALVEAWADIAGKRVYCDRYVDLTKQKEIDATFELSERTTLSGRVLDQQGDPVAAQIDWYVQYPGKPEALRGTWGVRERGAFQLPLAEQATYRLVVRCDGYQTLVRDGLRTGVGAQELVMEPWHRTRLRIRPALGGVAARSAMLDVWACYFDTRGAAARDWPLLTESTAWSLATVALRGSNVELGRGTAGQWRCEHHSLRLKDGVAEVDVARGPAYLLVSARGGRGTGLSRHGSGYVTIGEDPVELSMALQPVVGCKGQVRFRNADDRVPVAVALADDAGNLMSVSSHSFDMQWDCVLDTSSHGHFSLSGVPAGVWELRVGTPAELLQGEARWRRRVVLAGDRNEPITVIL